MTAAVAASPAGPAPDSDNNSRIEDELSYPILLSDRLRKAAEEAVFFKSECSEIIRLVERLSAMLRSAVRSATSSSQIYDRPLRRISADVTRNLDRALTLVRKCRRRSFLHRVVTIVTAADFRKIFSLLEASIGDMRWFLSILDGGDDGGIPSLPPIASNDPILSWVWSFTATIQMGRVEERVEAATELASLAEDNDRNKKMIVEEGGIPPLLKLLKEGSSGEAQIAAASALYHLSNDGERVRTIVKHMGAPLIVQVLADSSMKVQISVANLIARMAEFDDVAKEEFARENVIRPLVSLLSFETFDDELDHKRFNSSNSQLGKQSFHSIVQINKEKEKKEYWKDSIGVKHKLSSSSYSSFSSVHSEGGSSRGGVQTRKERENESPEVKRELKISCAKALWMLAKDSVSNSRRITETKGLLCLARLIEKEKGELQKNCLMAIMEITLAAESNPDLRRSAFKTNSPAAKAVVDQLLRVIKETHDTTLQIPAIKSIGSLSRTFPARETRVICPLVDQLSNSHPEVATEAAIALGKFASPENFLCQEHTRAIIEFNGVLPLLRLLRVSEKAQVHGLILLCYLAINGSNNEALEQARVLTALEGVDWTIVAQQPELRELITNAMYHLSLYHSDIHPHRQSSLRR